MLLHGDGIPVTTKQALQVVNGLSEMTHLTEVDLVYPIF